ncbi:MAG: hypothetical protein ACLP9L_25740 [Thermoguttaceae bacterium]
MDITPPVSLLPIPGGQAGSRGLVDIRDGIYVRAILVDNGVSRALILGYDLIITTAFYDRVARRVTTEAGIPVENFLLTVNNTHSAPFVTGRPPTAEKQVADADAKTAAYTSIVENATMEAVRKAAETLQSARVGFGKGSSDLNVNRDGPTPYGYYEEDNPDGPADKTVSVMKFEALSGEPIAFFIVCSLMSTVQAQPEGFTCTGDIGGATSRFVEEYYAGKPVAVWTRGGASNVNPRYMTWYFAYGPSGEIIQKRRETDLSLIDAMGKILAEEVIRVSEKVIRRTTPRATIWGAQKVTSCPGQRRVEPHFTPKAEISAGWDNTPDKQGPWTFKYENAPAADIPMALLMINHIALAALPFNTADEIELRLKRESPFTATMLVTQANSGGGGHIASDDQYAKNAFVVSGIRFKIGCVEDAVINGFLDMMNENRGN